MGCKREKGNVMVLSLAEGACLIYCFNKPKSTKVYLAKYMGISLALSDS